MAKDPSLLSTPIQGLLSGKQVIAGGVPEGVDAMLLAQLAREAAKQGQPILHVARDAQRMTTLENAIQFFAPDVAQLSLPAWDSVPYDRVAPNSDLVAQRILTLGTLANRDESEKQREEK